MTVGEAVPVAAVTLVYDSAAVDNGADADAGDSADGSDGCSGGNAEDAGAEMNADMDIDVIVVVDKACTDIHRVVVASHLFYILPLAVEVIFAAGPGMHRVVVVASQLFCILSVAVDVIFAAAVPVAVVSSSIFPFSHCHEVQKILVS